MSCIWRVSSLAIEPVNIPVRRANENKKGKQCKKRTLANKKIIDTERCRESMRICSEYADADQTHVIFSCFINHTHYKYYCNTSQEVQKKSRA